MMDMLRSARLHVGSGKLADGSHDMAVLSVEVEPRMPSKYVRIESITEDGRPWTGMIALSSDRGYMALAHFLNAVGYAQDDNDDDSLVRLYHNRESLEGKTFVMRQTTVNLNGRVLKRHYFYPPEVFKQPDPDIEEDADREPVHSRYRSPVCEADEFV
jgi:hypothetical protein